mmetsp:Transcript_25253/g.79847  ORF Transcript_25253/g.79847 Transcript_25253/m.79847 type:complete len:410 (-) Transcript_25253:351-1580(-)
MNPQGALISNLIAFVTKRMLLVTILILANLVLHGVSVCEQLAFGIPCDCDSLAQQDTCLPKELSYASGHDMQIAIASLQGSLHDFRPIFWPIGKNIFLLALALRNSVLRGERLSGPGDDTKWQWSRGVQECRGKGFWCYFEPGMHEVRDPGIKWPGLAEIKKYQKNQWFLMYLAAETAHFVFRLSQFSLQAMKSFPLVEVGLLQSSSSSITMHVRRGDSCDYMAKSIYDVRGRFVRPCFPFKLYMDAALKMQKLYNVSTINLLTDSDKVLKEVELYPSFKFRFFELDRKIFTPKNVGGRSKNRPEYIENRVRAGELRSHVKHIVVSALAELELGRRGDFFIGSAESTMGRLVYLLMFGKNKRAPPFISLGRSFCGNQNSKRKGRHLSFFLDSRKDKLTIFTRFNALCRI